MGRKGGKRYWRYEIGRCRLSHMGNLDNITASPRAPRDRTWNPPPSPDPDATVARDAVHRPRELAMPHSGLPSPTGGKSVDPGAGLSVDANLPQCSRSAVTQPLPHLLRSRGKLIAARWPLRPAVR